MSDTPKTIEVIKPCPQCMTEVGDADATCGIGTYDTREGHEGAEVINLAKQEVAVVIPGQFTPDGPAEDIFMAWVGRIDE